MENKKEITEMENKNLFQRAWQSLAMLLALVLLWWLTGVSIWYSIIFLLFFWLRSQMEGKPANYRALSVAMIIVFCIALGNAGINKVLPRTASKKVPTIAFIDQMISKGAPSETKVRAQDIFDMNYKDASEKLLVDFENLMKQGKVEEASKLLEDFEKKWTFSPFKKQKEEESNEDSSSSVSPESPGIDVSDTQNLTLYKGSWYVDVKGVSSNIVIKSPKKTSYSIEPVDGVYDYQVLLDGETLPIQAGPDVRLKDSPEPKFRIIYRGEKSKRLKITVH